MLSVYGWARLIYSLQASYWLDFSDVRPGPVYLAVTGGLWGVSGLVASIWIYLLRKGYHLAGVATAFLMALLYWVDRVLFNRSGGPGANVLFASLLTLFLLFYTALALGLFAGMRGALFPEKNQRESDVKVRARD